MNLISDTTTFVLVGFHLELNSLYVKVFLHGIQIISHISYIVFKICIVLYSIAIFVEYSVQLSWNEISKSSLHKVSVVHQNS